MRPDDPWQRLYKAKSLLKADLLPLGDDAQDVRFDNVVLDSSWPQYTRDVDLQLVNKGDDLGGTGFFPLLEAARRFGGALLSVLRVRR